MTGGTTLGFIAVNALNFGIHSILAAILTFSSLVILRLSKFLSDFISSRQRRCENATTVGARLCAKVKTSCHRSEYKT
jgi:hypothetical protein